MPFNKPSKYSCTIIRLSSLLLVLQVTLTFAQVPSKEVNWPVFMAKQNLKWDNIATDYYSGIILGNGLLGTNIYKENDSLIRFDIGRSDVVDHREKLMPDAGKLYTQGRLPIGYFTLKTSGKITGAKMELDIYNAEARGTITTTLGTITFKAYVAANQNVISISLNAAQQEKVSAWGWNPGKSISPRYLQSYPTDKPANYPENPQVKITSENGYTICNQPLLNKGGYTTAYKITGNATSGKLLVSVGYDAYNTLDEISEALNNLKNFKDNTESIAAHRNWWHHYYQQSFVALPDKRMENFYWIQLYKLASVTRADKPIADLMGPWTTATPWPAIWWNLNAQLTYSPIFTANHLELGESLFKSLNDNKQNLINNVPAPWRNDAAAIGRSSSYNLISQITEAEINKGTFEPANLTWMLYYYYQYYAYSKDAQTLKTKIYPLLKRSANFLIHQLKQDEKGIYHFPLSYSPEYKSAEDANYTLSSLSWALQTLIKVNQEQKLNDSDAEQWENILKNLVPFPAGDTGFLIGKDVPLNSSHRHYSHLLMIYPYSIINWEQPENRAIISLSLDNWLSRKSALAGFSFSGAASIYAGTGNGDMAYQWLNELFDRFVQPNTLYRESGPVIETPLAAATSIQEMLIQSWGDKIRIFPAVPSGWKEVSFKQLRAEGAFLVSADMQNGQTKNIKINSLKGGALTLVSNMDKFSIHSNKRNKIDYQVQKEGEKIKIEIKKVIIGEVISLVSTSFEDKTTSGLPYSLYPNWFWGLNNK
ncbi:glycosyl hydrolase family 95 catalytic domain-containing protein [Pedobacter jeongneungensis]|uniref:glycosyl hydrolase family 95 catalytic domain-containing protein n=1 Tax=Pedobacter jeongneungensis TaxID=947309 RepID=UPI0031D86EDE